ncbi:uncharacterized protein TrAtP1_004069 [Trichoderma atroviride]|uniref:uncharacterized protein n=1 Tax=Hypocrea atroviridis TaxID=63577 RepID=UPI00331EDF32|nr:hypothetical protein TrAtP1_004069 [Trichoderma atroviride]
MPSAPEIAVPRSLQATVATVGAGGKLELSGLRDENDAGSERSNSDCEEKKIEIMAVHLGLLNNLGTGGGTTPESTGTRARAMAAPIEFPLPQCFFLLPAPCEFAPGRHRLWHAPPTLSGTRHQVPPLTALEKYCPPEVCMLSSITPQTPPASCQRGAAVLSPKFLKG